MATRNPRTSRGIAICLAIVLPCAAVFGLFWWLWSALTVDYSREPPDRVFQLILKQPVPSGVSNLHIAGHGVMMGHTVWMKFSATDAAIRQLTKGIKPAYTDLESASSRSSRQRIMSDEYARSIGWEEVVRLKQVEFYTFDFAPGGSGWVGDIIVDREKHLVYIVADVL